MSAGAQSNGQRVRDLSLKDCYAYDPNPSRRGDWLRFRCCRHGGDRQQSLGVNEQTGKFRCFNGSCAIWGTVTEKQERREPGTQQRRSRPLPPLPEAEPLPPNIRAVERSKAAWRAFSGSPAETYATARGIAPEVARTLGLGYWRGLWQDEDSEWLTFPLRCPVTGKPIAVYGRNIRTDEQDRKGRVLGKRGLFGAEKPGPMPEDVILVEGPFEVLALRASPGLPPARAVIGASARAEWFDTCRRVTVLFDDDEAGREAADRLVTDLNQRRLRRNGGPQVLCLRPESLQKRHGCKDLGELLKQGEPVRLQLPPLDITETALDIPKLVVARHEAAPWDLVRATYKQIAEETSPGAIAWAEQHAPELLQACDQAEAAVDAALAGEDRDALNQALAVVIDRHAALSAARAVEAAKRRTL